MNVTLEGSRTFPPLNLRQDLGLFFREPRGKIVFEPKEIEVMAGEDVAFAVCLFHCDGTSGGALDFRLTTGLRREADEWVIVHEHHSLGTIEERFIDTAAQHAKA